MLDNSPLFSMIELESTSSTNSFVKDYKPLKPVDMLLVTAEYQTAGRGQATNTWEAEAGQNLLFSLCVSPAKLPVANIFSLSEAIALSIREAVVRALNGEFVEHEELSQAKALDAATSSGEAAARAFADGVGAAPEVTVKWPNDIYVGNCKVAGILIENEFCGTCVGRSIIGCGVDVNQQHFHFPEAEAARSSKASRMPVPASLSQLAGRSFNRQQVLSAIVEAFRRHYNAIRHGDGEAIAQLHAAYLNVLYRRQGTHCYEDASGLFSAKIVDVEPSGHLVLSDEAGKLRRYAFKEVAYV